jgi:O-acetyl-ADP-ribose deacetylase (regulator of RNase III)
MRAIVGSILDTECEAIVNAANGIGVLGAGVAGAIRNAGGMAIQDEAKDICRKNGRVIEAGKCYRTGSGKLLDKGIKYVYHAVTMEYPGGRSSLKNVRDAIRAVLKQAMKDGVKSIAIPGLGTGIGGLDKESVARIMVSVADDFFQLDVEFVDCSQEFIDYVKKFSFAVEAEESESDNECAGQSDVGPEQE